MSDAIAKWYGPADAGRSLKCSATTVRRLAAELGIEPLRTVSGARCFSAQDVERMRAERTRRAVEAVRR